ncbi:MAG TPA: hypothetical protein VK581_00515 [Chthoniobacterales bacterium]|nr:hypothetical protein [Chthoniobacterales bacterium]
MKTESVPLLTLAILALLVKAAIANPGAYTPPPGSTERKAILDAYRAEWTTPDSIKDVIFVVTHLKVHDGWAWLEVNPRSSDGSQRFESEQGLLHKEGAGWKVLQRKSGTTARYFKNLKAKFPAVPADIFPPA